MNSTLRAQPTLVPRLLLPALLIGLLLPFAALAEEAAAATAAAQPADIAAPTPAAGNHPQAEALKARLDALGEQATAQQVEAARREFVQQHAITDAEQLFAALQALPPEAAPPETAPLHDLSPWGMYQSADRVVKSVMIGLVLASILTWTVWIAKGLELLVARRRL